LGARALGAMEGKIYSPFSSWKVSENAAAGIVSVLVSVLVCGFLFERAASILAFKARCKAVKGAILDSLYLHDKETEHLLGAIVPSQTTALPPCLYFSPDMFTCFFLNTGDSVLI
jgi:hypothetical protein